MPVGLGGLRWLRGFRSAFDALRDALEVDALPSLSFQAKDFTVPAGIIQINYIDIGGTHTLVFDSPKLSGFQLNVPQGPTSGKVRLEPGSYTIYCTIQATAQQENKPPSPSHHNSP